MDTVRILVRYGERAAGFAVAVNAAKLGYKHFELLLDLFAGKDSVYIHRRADDPVHIEPDLHVFHRAAGRVKNRDGLGDGGAGIHRVGHTSGLEGELQELTHDQACAPLTGSGVQNSFNLDKVLAV